MTFDSFDTWWWPLVFIAFAGWFATDFWRYLGVYLGGKMRDDSPALIFVRAVATSLVAAVIGNLIVFPTGPLAETSVWLRVGAAAAGFGAFLITGKRMLVGIFVAEALLLAGIYLL